MNLLEVHIKEIHSVEYVEKDWGSFVLVDLTTNCYGNTKRDKQSFSREEWEEAKSKGYYMA